MRTRISHLVTVATEHHTATASNGRWYAYRQADGWVEVWHYSTQMIKVHPERRRVVAVNEGWGSQTDKQGINAILRFEKLPDSYWSLFEGEDVATCPACGDPIDYCQGHGEYGDSQGHAILAAHDDGDHGDCDPQGCEEAA